MCRLAGWLLGLLTSAALADGPAGAPFSDPDYRASVPAQWDRQPIRYEAWAEGADLAVTLDQHLYQALLPSIKRFADRNRLNIAVKEGTCGISAGKLTDRVVDMGGFCCPPGPEDRLPGLRFVTLGIGAIALLVHRDNPVETITLEQARALFEGTAYRWNDLGQGPERPAGFVHPVGRLHCKRRPGHWRLLLADENRFSPRLIEVTTIPDMIAAIASDRGAVGYEVLWMVEKANAWGRVKALAIDGISPFHTERLAAGGYPLYRTFNLAIWEGETANPHAARLARRLRAEVGELDPKYGIVAADRLRRTGWRFFGDELVGEPR